MENLLNELAEVIEFERYTVEQDKAADFLGMKREDLLAETIRGNLSSRVYGGNLYFNQEELEEYLRIETERPF